MFHNPAALPGQENLYRFFEMLAESQGGQKVKVERRNSVRIEYPYPIYLTPVDGSEQTDLDESFCVLGRHISDRGFDFYHKDPISLKKVVASFEYSPNRWLAATADLNWCRFGRHGYFENGGTFCHVVDSPFGIGKIDG